MRVPLNLVGLDSFSSAELLSPNGGARLPTRTKHSSIIRYKMRVARVPPCTRPRQVRHNRDESTTAAVNTAAVELSLR